jgi:acyl carrier protein
MQKLSLSEIYEKVSAIIVDHLGDDIKEKIVPGASIVGDLGADSLDTAELGMRIEKEFIINLQDKEVEEIDDIQSLVELINEKLV